MKKPKKIMKLYLEDVSKDPCVGCGNAHYLECAWCDRKKHFKRGISLLKLQNLVKRMYLQYSDRCFEDREIFSPKDFARLVANNLFFISKNGEEK